jgi:GT2 family glycosyltransferase
MAVTALLSCEYPPSRREIIVVEETDYPEPIIEDGVKYVVIPGKNRGYGFARNTGVSHAAFDLCAFIDDDCIADPRWLLELALGMLRHPDAAAIGGAVRVPPCGPIGACENILGFPGGGVKYIHESHGAVVARPTFSTCNCMVRLDAIQKAGGFDERLRLGSEDEMLSRKIAAFSRVLFSPFAIVYHAPRDNLLKIFQWFVRRGRARASAIALTTALQRENRALIRNSPFLRMGAALTILALLRVALLPGFLLLGGFYYVFILWRYRWALKHFPSLPTSLCLPVVKMIMDMGYDVGLIAGKVYPEK